jgi:hypothetical protein
VTKRIASITDFTPQAQNANAHTPRGMGELERSIQQDGWIGAITVAADGESFDGSARIEVSAAVGLEDVIVVETDGSRPVVVRRTDIPTADDPRARRLGVAANRVAELNLSWDAAVLDGLVSEGIDLTSLFRDGEMPTLPESDDWAGAFGLPDGDRAPFQQMTFTVSDDQAEQIKIALEKARRMGPFVDTGNENGNGNALARVCEMFNG